MQLIRSAFASIEILKCEIRALNLIWLTFWVSLGLGGGTVTAYILAYGKYRVYIYLF